MRRIIRVQIIFTALHHWPDPIPRRTYLGYPHRHDFRIVGEAEVSHANRDIEFHDLQDRLRTTAHSISSVDDRQPWREHVRSFGSMSCEEIAEHILLRMPELFSVEVHEDDYVGARVEGKEIDDLGYGKMNPLPPSPVTWVMNTEVVTVCGSTRFAEETKKIIRTLTLENHVVHSVGTFSHAEGVELDEQTKAMLDHLHLRKISSSSWIYVVNVGGYIGESTSREIAFAESLGLPVVYHEPVSPKSEEE